MGDSHRNKDQKMSHSGDINLHVNSINIIILNFKYKYVMPKDGQ